MNTYTIDIFKKYSGPVFLATVGAYMIHLSWFKWPDIFIDYGRELYIPWQITQGRVLYADINTNHLYGPLAQYTNALLFHLFGVGLSTLVFFNIIMVILLSYLIYDLYKTTFGHLVSTSAVACFLVIFAFSQYVGIANYNYICPYSHELTYSIFLYFITLHYFRKYTAIQRNSYAAAIGFTLGCIFLAKVEVFIAALLSIAVGVFIIVMKIKPSQIHRNIMYMFLFFIMPILLFFIYFSFNMPISDAFKAVVISITNLFTSEFEKNPFFMRVMGFDDPSRNIILMLRQLYGYILVVFATFSISYIYSRLKNKVFKYLWISFVFALTAILVYVNYFRINWYEIARPFPIILAFILVSYLIRHFQEREDKILVTKEIHIEVFVIFSLLLMLKMVINVHIYHYGFVLAMPASIVMVAIFLHYVPTWCGRWGSKNVAMGLLGIFMVFAILFYLNITRQIYNLKDYEVGYGKDQFYTYSERVDIRGPIINATLKSIQEMINENETFIAFPEGVMLNYLSRRKNPSTFTDFIPIYFSESGRSRIMSSIEKEMPSFVIIIERDTSEFGARYFGRDYAVTLSEWIRENYDMHMKIGSEPLSGNGFGIIIAKKRE